MKPPAQVGTLLQCCRGHSYHGRRGADHDLVEQKRKLRLTTRSGVVFVHESAMCVEHLSARENRQSRATAWITVYSCVITCRMCKASKTDYYPAVKMSVSPCFSWGQPFDDAHLSSWSRLNYEACLSTKKIVTQDMGT